MNIINLKDALDKVVSSNVDVNSVKDSIDTFNSVTVIDKTNEFNSNVNDKLDEYNSNHETKMIQYNSNCDIRIQDIEELNNDSKLEYYNSIANRLTTDSYANEEEDVFVKIYSSNGDGTFSYENTDSYSALHWRNKAKAITTGDDILLKSENLEGIVDTSIARANIGLEIDKDVQSYNIDTVIDGNYVHTDNNFTSVLLDKLNGIESNAKDDQSASEVELVANGNLSSTDVQSALYELQSDIDIINTSEEWN